uniref:hypothetical protein n=1 Tax=Candidatus Williamhamiltonella defendens TaxID=138072 RepID=UPI0012FEB424
EKSYAQHLGEALKHQAGWQMDIGARRLPVRVNAQGRKFSVVNEAASEEMPDKVVFRWTPEGELVVQKTRFSDRVTGVLSEETLSSWEPPLCGGSEVCPGVITNGVRGYAPGVGPVIGHRGDFPEQKGITSDGGHGRGPAPVSRAFYKRKCGGKTAV